MYLDKLLPLFVSTDTRRPAMCAPHTVGDYTYASEGHALIAIPNHLLQETYPDDPNGAKTPDFQSVIDQCAKHPIEPLQINLLPILDFLGAIKREAVYADCEKCEGSGTRECGHCGSDYDCTKCGGSGKGKRIGDQIPAKYRIRLGPAFFVAQVFNRMVLALAMQASFNTHPPALLLVSKLREGAPAMFKCGEITFLITSYTQENEDQEGPHIFNYPIPPYASASENHHR